MEHPSVEQPSWSLQSPGGVCKARVERQSTYSLGVTEAGNSSRLSNLRGNGVSPAVSARSTAVITDESSGEVVSKCFCSVEAELPTSSSHTDVNGPPLAAGKKEWQCVPVATAANPLKKGNHCRGKDGK